MPLTLALDWNRDTLTCVEADVSSGRVAVRKIVELSWPADADVETAPAVLGDWLKAQLAEHGIHARRTILVLSREEVVTRRLELPAAPDEELPELVRFQAATRSATPLDQLAIDFVPLPAADPESGRNALMLSIDRPLLDGLRTACETAGLDLVAVQASPFALAELAVRFEQQQGEDANATTLIVLQNEHRVEITILQGLGLVFSHHTRIAELDDRAVRSAIAEINRSIVVLRQMLHESVDIARVCLIRDGEVGSALEEALATRFSGRLHVITPSGDRNVSVAEGLTDDQLSGLATPLGALLGEFQRVVPSIDFLHPRKAPPKRDEKKRRMIIAGSAVAAVLLVAFLAGWWYSSSLSSEIGALRSQVADLNDTLTRGQPDLRSHASVSAWVAQSVDPLAETDRLHQLLPGGDRLILQKLNVARSRSDDAIARLLGGGIARTEEDIDDLFRVLDQNGYRVRPQVTVPYRLDPDYPHQFTLDAERLRPQPRPGTNPAS